VFHIAGGNPLFIENVVHQLTREAKPRTPSTLASLEPAAPREIADAIAVRLGELSEPAQSTLTLAAVIGDRFDPARIAAAGDVPAETVIEHLESAATQGIVEHGDARTFHFGHPL
jgi:predicted ATPase